MERPRLIRPGPIGGLVVVVGLWFVAPELFTGTVSDAATFGLVLALAAAVVAWVWVMRRFVSRPVLRLGLIGIPLLVLAWTILWPYVRPATRVDEAFPTATTSVVTSTTTTSTNAPTTTALPSTMSSSASPTSSPRTTTTTTTTVPPAPVELRRADFRGLTGHRGSGAVALYRLEGGTFLLRFEDVDIGSGPDLNVWLVPGADQRSTSGGTFIAALTAEQGNQNYAVPDGVDPTAGEWTVLVWCTTFSVEVANATLT